MSTKPNSITSRSINESNEEFLASLESPAATSTFLVRASSMIAYGVPIVPLPPNKKFPPPTGWQQMATTDINVIKGWLVPNGQPAVAFPDSNCASVATLDGVWFLDIDNMQVVSEQIEKETGHKLQEIMTLIVRSSGEKQHLYFKQNEASRALGNVDYDAPNGAELFSARVTGKYVVSPRSIHPDTGAEYEVTRDTDITEAPTWLMDWLKTAKRASGERKEKRIADVTAKISEGGRDDGLFALACQYRDNGMSQTAALAALLDDNSKRCIPPLTAEIVKTKIKSAYTRGARKKPTPLHSAETFVESGTSPTCAGEKLNLTSLADIEAEIQQWLWENRIPKDALTNLSGDADKGKSLTLYDILARISIGADFPDGAKNPFGGKPKRVLLMFSEGSLKTTVKPRMMVMGANMENVITLKSVSRKGEKDATKRQFYLETDLSLLREALRNDPEIVAIGFDPITNYLGDECNMNRSQDVRRVLTPVGELAEDCGVSIISIIHFSKNTAMSAIHRTGGAAALVEVPRAAWCCADDDDPENKGGFVFVRIKNNLGKRVGGLCYRIEEAFISIKGKRASVPRLVWGKPTEKTADDLLSLQNDPEMKGVAKARSWLEETFKDDFARKSSVVFNAALAIGITEDCLKKARRSLRMESKKVEWQWYMRRQQGQSQSWRISTDLEEKSTVDTGEYTEMTF